ncbi:MAG: 4-hydroxythreonine-4-phosphate dehydrogenase PdxA [Planctomycetes bacterium]|nr:4-hydroxythreonine-4-phosphate dehydrogenase PdxA [Planctomycetota bacterium]
MLFGKVEALQKLATACVDAGVIEPSLGNLVSVATAEEGFALPATGPLPVIELEAPQTNDPIGKPCAAFGLASTEANLRAGQLCLSGGADLVVTPPIHKESMHLAGYPYEGQTQMFGELSGSRRYGMLACSGDLRVLIATRHMALREALDRLEIGLVAKQIRIAHESARETLGLDNPRVVLAGLNPHAGESGAFGKEETKVLLPAIERAKQEWGFETAGPAVPDVVFGEGRDGHWDVVVALYHDQAFIPLRLLGRERAWTLLVGAKGLLRVSPMHGSAYDLAAKGPGSADPEPFAFAVERGLELAMQKIAEASV